MILLADNEGSDQPAQMLIWALAVRRCPKARLRMARTTYQIKCDLAVGVDYGLPEWKIRFYEPFA